MILIVMATIGIMVSRIAITISLMAKSMKNVHFISTVTGAFVAAVVIVLTTLVRYFFIIKLLEIILVTYFILWRNQFIMLTTNYIFLYIFIYLYVSAIDFNKNSPTNRDLIVICRLLSNMKYASFSH